MAVPEVRMIQQLSGRRPDGRSWPPVGGTIEVDEAEARELCHTAAQSSHPIAVLVKEERAEAAVADERQVETAAPKATRQARPEPRPARTAVTEQRG